MGFQHIVPWNSLNSLEKFFDVQTGSLTITGSSNTDTITAVDLTKSVLEFSYEYNSNSNDPQNIMVTGVITNATTLTFKRGSTSGTITIRWYIWEARPNNAMTVQRGVEDVGNNVSLPVSVNIPTDINLSNAFPIISVNSDDTNVINNNNQVRAEITAVDTLQLDKDGNSSPDNEVAWQIINNPNWDVTKYNVDLSGVTNKNVTLSPTVPTAQAYVTCSGESVGATLNGDEIYRFNQNSSSNAEFDRDSSSQGGPATLYVIDTFGDIQTEHDSTQIGNGDTTDTVNLTELVFPTARSLIKLHSIQNAQTLFNSGTSDGDHTLVCMEFNSTTQTKATRGNASSNPTKYRFSAHKFN